MLINNIEIDTKVKCIENDISQTELATKIGTSKSYLNRLIKKQKGIVNNIFLIAMEELGYDIEIIYKKREE
ncbi:TPA: helix-turn-helix domain-containing protein [Enterococcus faecalis]|uniref:helix-turn-helix domain-containing protein n=1 Tax=Aerococcus urinae TaxID=1376 RepID=UPI0018E18269|nr:helix-turn-helix transcriptional regulator [Aerococcus urinae]HAP3611821.1 helix-turn-helix transcriptional regulator [Enterococcus faecalis]HAP3613753.1 helix-turn-helix transcriptional regulator [Enterococcus faecalis]HBE2178978.1 helix-turn-helix transcriptional regulator [Enterococcus faecalis]HBE2185024.1 helix-turn-helix transcriptional regulator [Enterococcus faecalis]